MRLFIIAAVASVGVATSAQAQFLSKISGSVGGGVAFAPDYEGSDDYEFQPLAFGRVTYDNLVTLDLTKRMLGVNLLNRPNLRMGPMVKYRAHRDSDDNTQIEDLEDVDWAIEIGGFLEYQINNLVISLSGSQDIGINNNSHEGHIVELGADYLFQLNPRLRGSFGVSTAYGSDRYMDSYFGVSRAEATNVINNNGPTALQSQYDPGSGLYQATLNARIAYALSPRFSVQGIAAYKRLFSDAADSPLVGGSGDGVGDEDQLFFGSGISYRF